MEILQFLLSNFFGDNLKAIAPVFDLLKKHDFNVIKCLPELTPEMLAPIFSGLFNQNKSPTEHVGQGYGIAPIAKIADKDIVYTLNKYMSC